MVAALTFNVISLGTLPLIDPYEYNDTAENAGSLVGQTFDHFTADNLQTFRPAAGAQTFNDTPDSNGCYDTYNQDSSTGADYFEIVAADGTVSLHRFDAVVAYQAEVSYIDRTTGQKMTETVEIGVVQDAQGNSWVVPPSSYSPHAALLDYTVTAISITGVVHETWSGLYAWREQLPNLDTAPCFTPGTWIDTPTGPRLIETLAAGDLVLTRDHGAQPLRWIGQRALSAQDLAANPHLHPIRIAAGALGAGAPVADLIVSPQHRVLVRSAIAQRMFSAPEVLVAAKQLCDLDGIAPDPEATEVIYIHLLFDRHEVVTSNGAATESLYTGPEAMRALGAAARAEILALFPELADEAGLPAAARPLVAGRPGRRMAERHARNGQPLVG